ncbi:hypothetical protein IQ13_0451 [Lacibacter cauensis]|uniref:Uncharacterized protein n=1 Tax=Lacibacter cauensis TaxID=510947 RepID=A0A562SVN4_9BACT|nr:hypothetical protein [Lacibacter cauensis]TWI85292.1 hypothetical protein IQ13_0451 [Lacibacter cauensis]
MHQRFETIFEVTSQPINYWWAFPLIFIIVGVLFFKSTPPKSFDRVFLFLFITFFVCVFVYLTEGNFKTYLRLRSLYKEKKYKIVEGYVTDFVAGRTKVKETYKVNGIPFSQGYAWYGYKENYESDGSINEGKYVRLFYIESGKEKIILRVDIAR